MTGSSGPGAGNTALPLGSGHCCGAGGWQMEAGAPALSKALQPRPLANRAVQGSMRWAH